MTRLTINGKTNCFELPDNSWEQVEEIAGRADLTPGNYQIQIDSGSYTFWKSGDRNEPFAMLWLRGGRFVNLATGIETSATLISLNGLKDVVKIRVKQATQLFAFFLDSFCANSGGTVVISVESEPASDT